jgi:small subunit ribosomal protein S1
MEGSWHLEQMSVDERGWWTRPDEGYWQALLTQGALAPDSAPPADYHEIFETLGVESEMEAADNDSARGGGNAPDMRFAWQNAQRSFNQGELFNLRISGANRGGLLVDWNGLQGFVPASHLNEMPLDHDPQDRVSELAQRIGDSLTVRLIEVDEPQNRLVFSERAALSDFRSPASIMDSLRPGDTWEGTVTNLTSFGAFVDLGGFEGLVHISEISWDRVRHPGDALQPGQKLTVYVLSLNPDEGRIALSLRRLRPNPWTQVDARYRVGQVIEGTVTNVVSFGAFVRVEEGLEGLIHVSELAEGTFLHPRSVVREGDQVRVRVLNIDVGKRRLGLSLRQAGAAYADVVR